MNIFIYHRNMFIYSNKNWKCNLFVIKYLLITSSAKYFLNAYFFNIFAFSVLFFTTLDLKYFINHKYIRRSLHSLQFVSNTILIYLRFMTVYRLKMLLCLLRKNFLNIFWKGEKAVASDCNIKCVLLGISPVCGFK